MKLLIDTNVILDALMDRKPRVRDAEAILLACTEEKAKGCITASTFTDIYYMLRRHLRDREQTKQALLKLLSVVDVLDVSGVDCEKAFDLPMADYEDALLAYCAKRHRMDRIVTRNPKHFAGSPVKAVSPEELLKTLG
jgi:predicted nucleic acid-binding protein